MTNPQTEARAIEMRAWNCDEWPEWLHKIVDQTNEVADRLDMSAEQAHAYAVLIAIAAKDAELATLHEADGNFWEAIARAERAEAQLAEARKALEPFADIADTEDEVGRDSPDDDRVWVVQAYGCQIGDLTVEHFRAARRALEAQGGE